MIFLDDDNTIELGEAILKMLAEIAVMQRVVYSRKGSSRVYAYGEEHLSEPFLKELEPFLHVVEEMSQRIWDKDSHKEGFEQSYTFFMLIAAHFVEMAIESDVPMSRVYDQTVDEKGEPIEEAIPVYVGDELAYVFADLGKVLKARSKG